MADSAGRPPGLVRRPVGGYLRTPPSGLDNLLRYPLGGITAFTASDVTRSVNDCDVATVGLSALGVHVLV